MTMQICSNDACTSFADDSSQATGQDFNTDDAWCDELSTGSSDELSTGSSDELSTGSSDPVEVEIFGLEILLDRMRLVDDTDDDSLVSFEVDSLVLARRRLSHIHHNRHGARPRRRLGGSVDSLVLARRRLSHIVHERNNTKRSAIHSQLRMLRSSKRPKSDDDSSATSSEESSTYTSSTSSDESSAFTFDCSTVDSLILARERLASRRVRTWINRRVSESQSTSESNNRGAPVKVDHKQHPVCHQKGFHGLVANAIPNTGGGNRAA
jgi:hypothetical protein